jgi:hypothetical protein
MAHARLPRVPALSGAAPAPRPAGLPPLAADPWALLVALCVVPLLFAARRTPMGEPFSDDFQFLDFSLLHGNPSWWDGGGSASYWRPLARQAYYGLLGPLMLAHPAAIAALHALALADTGVLLARALRRAWPAPAAAAAAAFPLLLESARTLLAWPSGAQDLGALFFLALALHAAARGRVALLAAAGVAASLCKEVAAPLALLAALAPFPRRTGSPWRAPLVTAGALAAWSVLRFVLPHPGLGIAIPASPLAASIPPAGRLAQAFALAARDAFSLDRAPAWAAGVAIAVAALPVLVELASPHARPADAWRWSAWGAGWFVAGAAPLAFFLPDWASFRSVLPAAGLGVALVAPLAMARARSLVPLAAVRLCALLFAVQPAARIGVDVAAEGDALGFPRLAQLQRMVHGVRGTLGALAPSLPKGARVMREGWPLMTGVAFGGDRSLGAWYRDTTLRWVGRESLTTGDGGLPVAMVEFEPYRLPQFAGVNADAIRLAAAGEREVNAGHWAAALPLLDRAEALQPDTTAGGFRASLAGARAYCLIEMDRVDEAEAQARIAMGRDINTLNGRFIFAQARLARGDWRAAMMALRDHLGVYKHDQDAMRMLRETERLEALER